MSYRFVRENAKSAKVKAREAYPQMYAASKSNRRELSFAAPLSLPLLPGLFVSLLHFLRSNKKKLRMVSRNARIKKKNTRQGTSPMTECKGKKKKINEENAARNGDTREEMETPVADLKTEWV